jgi:hypothetical protein
MAVIGWVMNAMFLEVDEIGGVYPEEGDGEGLTGQRDPRPEYFQYRDEGCKRADSCLECPFPHCFYEMPRPQNKPRRLQYRDEDIKNLRWAGKSIKQLSRRFKITERSIERILNGRPSRAEGPDKRKGDVEDE